MRVRYSKFVYKTLQRHIETLWRRLVPEERPRAIETRGGYIPRGTGPEPTMPPPKPINWDTDPQVLVRRAARD
jgi:hypothetical protein